MDAEARRDFVLYRRIRGKLKGARSRKVSTKGAFMRVAVDVSGCGRNLEADDKKRDMRSKNGGVRPADPEKRVSLVVQSKSVSRT